MGSLKKGKNLGERLKEIRNAKGLSLDFLANDTGFSVDYIARIEKGEVIPPVATILMFSRSLEIDSGILLMEKKNKPDKKNIDEFVKRTENYSYKTLTSEALRKHIKAFNVFIDPVAEHKEVGYQHEGEEFIYVLKGIIEVTVGDNRTILSQEDSIQFNSSIIHKLRNIGDEKAELLVVIFEP